MSTSYRFENKRILVTGAGTGIGREIALRFGQQGAKVALHYYNETEGAESAVKEIDPLGNRAVAIPGDFRNIEDVFTVSMKAIEFLGGLDILVNNAGITFNKPLLKITPEQFDVLYSVNVKAQLFLTQCAVREMMPSGGAIVNMTSIHGLQGAPEHSVYAGTKGAIISQTRVLGIELAHKGIRINAVAPGWVIVESHSKIFPGRTEESAMQAASESVPLGRPGFPADVADIVLFLCSEDARYIVGQTIVADGGTTALMSLISDFRTESTARCGLGYVPGV
jgi:NAD(P)-dependent dehydrogenase (short-subunit alcohol dehydrogenase family)